MFYKFVSKITKELVEQSLRVTVEGRFSLVVGHICITLDDLPVVAKAFCCIGFCAGFLGNFHDVLYFMLGAIFRKILEARTTDGFCLR